MYVHYFLDKKLRVIKVTGDLQESEKTTQTASGSLSGRFSARYRGHGFTPDQ